MADNNLLGGLVDQAINSGMTACGDGNITLAQKSLDYAQNTVLQMDGDNTGFKISKQVSCDALRSRIASLRGDPQTTAALVSDHQNQTQAYLSTVPQDKATRDAAAAQGVIDEQNLESTMSTLVAANNGIKNVIVAPAQAAVGAVRDSAAAVTTSWGFYALVGVGALVAAAVIVAKVA